MIEWIFTFLVVYLLYKLIFDFIIPVSRVSSQMRNKVNEINRQQQQQQKTYTQQKNSTTKEHSSSEDYIDFEEIK